MSITIFHVIIKKCGGIQKSHALLATLLSVASGSLLIWQSVRWLWVSNQRTKKMRWWLFIGGSPTGRSFNIWLCWCWMAWCECDASNSNFWKKLSIKNLPHSLFHSTCQSIISLPLFFYYNITSCGFTFAPMSSCLNILMSMHSSPTLAPTNVLLCW